jgi:hypothetical protein
VRSPISWAERQSTKPHDDPRPQIAECNDLENEAIDGKQHWSDQVLLRLTTMGDEQRTAAFLEDGFDLGFVELAAEFGFTLFNLRAQVLRELG